MAKFKKILYMGFRATLNFRKFKVENNRNGIRWKLTTTLDDLDFADDVALLSSRWSQAQDKLNRLNQFGGKVGLKINIDKVQPWMTGSINDQRDRSRR